jgi:hypothetical protein
VAGFAAFLARRYLHSRTVVSVVAVRLQRALAIGAFVFKFRTRGRRSKRLCQRVVLPHSLHGVHSDAECPDAPRLLQTRNLQHAQVVCIACSN